MTTKAKIIAIAAIATFSICFAQTAHTACTNFTDKWVCSNTGKQCHIEYVRYFPTGTQYLMVKLDDTVDNCRYIKFIKPNGACTGNAYTEGALRNLESIMLTAMTTGLPVRFYITERDGDICIAKTAIIFRP
jgi:hypothetical protein